MIYSLSYTKLTNERLMLGIFYAIHEQDTLLKNNQLIVQREKLVEHWPKSNTKSTMKLLRESLADIHNYELTSLSKNDDGDFEVNHNDTIKPILSTFIDRNRYVVITFTEDAIPHILKLSAIAGKKIPKIAAKSFRSKYTASVMLSMYQLPKLKKLTIPKLELKTVRSLTVKKTKYRKNTAFRHYVISFLNADYHRAFSSGV